MSHEPRDGKEDRRSIKQKELLVPRVCLDPIKQVYYDNVWDEIHFRKSNCTILFFMDKTPWF